MRVGGVFMPDMYTLKHWKFAFSGSEVWSATKNTIIVATGGATFGMILSAMVAYIVTRTRYTGRRALDFIAWIPWAVPGLVMALGLLWAYIYLPTGPVVIYGSIWLLIIAFTTRGFPLGTRSMTSTMVQIGSELEESSRVHGASWSQTFIRIWLPLLRAGFVGGWIILFARAVRDLNTVVLLYSPSSRVMSTEIFRYWQEGATEAASVIALLQTGLILAAFFVARLVTRERTHTAAGE
jgi:iron(III) transport system permease protein